MTLNVIYDPRFVTLFPRMWSDQSDHQAVYQEWGKVKGTPIQVTDPNRGEEGYQKTYFHREPEVYVLLPVRIYVFQIFHVEFCRKTE